MSAETAFHGRLRELTDRWTDLFGYAAPSVVSAPIEEYRAVRDAAGLMDFSMLRKVDITGPGAVDVVDWVLTRDVHRIRPGHIGYGALANDRGKMVDDCTAAVLSAEHVRFCGANDRDADYFAARAAGTDVVVRPFTDEMPHLCVQGPRSREILQPLLDRDLSNPAFPYYTFRDGVRCAGIPVFMTRLGYTAELGYELWVRRDRATELWDALAAAGRPHRMRVIGMEALDLLRIEGGFIIGGIEYDESVSPYECGLGWAVDLDKPDFQGKASLAVDREETQLRLTSVVLDDGGPAASNAPLRVDGIQAGFVTQAIAAPCLGGRTLGLAKLRRPHQQAGTRVEAEIGGRTVAGEVVRHPVYDPERRRAKELA